jgi:hypothetical protein
MMYDGWRGAGKKKIRIKADFKIAAPALKVSVKRRVGV